jgi:CRISPR/Cas system CMR-associated protein Cmr3 (group 5 of RAMP superfamily)
MLKEIREIMEFKTETINNLIQENQQLRKKNLELTKKLKILLRENALLQNPNARSSIESRNSI